MINKNKAHSSALIPGPGDPAPSWMMNVPKRMLHVPRVTHFVDAWKTVVHVRQSDQAEASEEIERESYRYENRTCYIH